MDIPFFSLSLSLFLFLADEHAFIEDHYTVYSN